MSSVVRHGVEALAGCETICSIVARLYAAMLVLCCSRKSAQQMRSIGDQHQKLSLVGASGQRRCVTVGHQWMEWWRQVWSAWDQASGKNRNCSSTLALVMHVDVYLLVTRGGNAARMYDGVQHTSCVKCCQQIWCADVICAVAAAERRCGTLCMCCM
jgi:hypothetical protein